MKLIENEEIESLNISPATCVRWAEEALKLKYKSQMPPKSAIHLHDSLNFFMTMPCLLPDEYGYFGCKNASRFDCSHPSVKSYMMLCNSHNGNFEALVNCDWITSRRTGATAALAIKTYRSKNAKIYSFMGMGLAGCSALECFLDASSNEQYTVRILRYKDHAEKTIEKFKHYKNVNFEIAETPELLIDGADVIVSIFPISISSSIIRIFFNASHLHFFYVYFRLTVHLPSRGFSRILRHNPSPAPAGSAACPY